MPATRATKRRKRDQSQRRGVTRLQAFGAVVGVLLLCAGGFYMYEREHRLNAVRDWEQYRIDGEWEAGMSPAERETRRIAREEAERAQGR